MSDDTPSQCSLLVLPDGRLLVRNVTPELSALLLALQPGNPDLARRVTTPALPLSPPIIPTQP